MGKVVRLSPSVVSRISAGEVVERPASCVKELVENSLDAGSSYIEILVTKGGKELIEVRDNGVGMGEDDAVLAVERHTTSKITSPEDIDRVATLGFRGEALYAISSVSLFTLITKTDEDDLATKVVVAGGNIVKVEKTYRPIRGTTARVENLFYNIRARREFLKSSKVEAMAIRSLVKNFALSWPEVSFRYVEDGKVVFVWESASLSDRIRDVTGGLVNELSGDMVRIFIVEGISEEFSLFVNRRYVYDRTIHNMIINYLKSTDLTIPGIFVFIEIDPHLVDVNVHPAKKEVRFRDISSILKEVSELLDPFKRKMQVIERKPVFDDLERLNYVGEFFDVYITFEDKVNEEIVIIDKHALHERILFDNIVSSNVRAHPVFFFVPDLNNYKDFLPLLEKMGFEYDADSAVIVRAPEWAIARLGEIISDLLKAFEAKVVFPKDYEEVAKIACRSAVKRGYRTTIMDARSLKEYLAEKGGNLTCPHGRPVVVRLKKTDFDALFKRRI